MKQFNCAFCLAKIFFYRFIYSMQINLQPYEKCYPKRLKRFFQTGINYRTYHDFIPHMKQAVVGNIPIEIITLFPKNKRGEGVKQIQEALAVTSLQLRKIFKEIRKEENFSVYDENYRPSAYMKKIALFGESCLNSELTKIFGEDNIKASLKFVGDGSFANVYQLSLKNKNGYEIMHDKALKVYHVISDGSMIHNTFAEANFWTFLKKIAGHSLAKTQYTKHYISDLHCGYCMTEFIDPQIQKTTSKLPIIELFKFKMPHDSMVNLPIMGKLYDGGGYEKEKSFIADKVVLKYLKMLFYAKGKASKSLIEQLNLLIANPKTPLRDKIQKAIELYENSIKQ